MADKPTKTEDAAAEPKSAGLFKVCKPITYQGPIDETTIDALILGGKLNATQSAAASKAVDKAALVQWYKATSNQVTYPNLPPVRLPFDHLAESARALLIKRGVIAVK